MSILHMDFTDYDNVNVPEEVKGAEAIDRTCVSCKHMRSGDRFGINLKCQHPVLRTWTALRGFKNAPVEELRRRGRHCGPRGIYWEQKVEAVSLWRELWPGIAFVAAVLTILFYMAPR